MSLVYLWKSTKKISTYLILHKFLKKKKKKKLPCIIIYAVRDWSLSQIVTRYQHVLDFTRELNCKASQMEAYLCSYLQPIRLLMD